MGVFDIIKSRKGSESKVLKPSSLEKLVFKNNEEIEKIHEEIEAINLSYEKYRKTHKKLIIGFGTSIIVNIILVIGILIKMFS